MSNVSWVRSGGPLASFADGYGAELARLGFTRHPVLRQEREHAPRRDQVPRQRPDVRELPVHPLAPLHNPILPGHRTHCRQNPQAAYVLFSSFLDHEQVMAPRGGRMTLPSLEGWCAPQSPDLV
jgi:hypothetical protein